MNRPQFLLIPLICCAMVPGDNPTSPAAVNSQNGISTYVYCLPDRPFDTVCTFTTDVGLNSYAGPSIPNKVIGFERPVDALVRQALRKEKKGPKSKRVDISGIISFDARQAIAIRFTTQIKESMVNRARARQYRGYYIFIQNRPVSKYEVLSKVNITSEIDLDFTGYTEMNTMLDSLINHYEKKALVEVNFRIGENDEHIPVKANGLITNTGLDAEFIHLNQ